MNTDTLTLRTQPTPLENTPWAPATCSIPHWLLAGIGLGMVLFGVLV